jgi:DNA-binding IclR family transcriptional regulator
MASRQMDFVHHAHPFLNELKQQCHETCYFSVIKDGSTCYLDGVESDLPVRVTHRLGSSRPLYCTAAGRAQLAFLELQQQADLISGSELKALTASTITDPGLLHNELLRVARQKYAVDNQEHDAGVMEIAAPVFDSYGAVIGALSILGPEMRLAGPRLEIELLPLLCQSASRLSSSLGYCPSGEMSASTSPQPPKSKRKTSTLETKSFVFGGLKNCC